MAVLTVVYVALAFSEDSPFGPQAVAVWGLAVIFLVEFGARSYDSMDRGRYLQTHWLDLVTAIPVPGIPGLRVIRLLRLLRFIKIGVLLRRDLLERGWNQAGLIWPTLALFWVGSALALWLVEHDAQGSTVTTFADAMTAAFLTAATLGFNKHGIPVTQDGQIISAFIVFFALGLWGFASSNLTHMWLKTQDDVPIELRAFGQEITALREDVRRLSDRMYQLPTNIGESQSGDLLPDIESSR